MVENSVGRRSYAFGISAIGNSHIESNKECQDSCKIVNTSSYNIIAVADGHGSEKCPYSKTGSQIAVNVFCDIVGNVYENFKGDVDGICNYFGKFGDTLLAKEVLDEWRKRVRRVHTNNKREKKSNSEPYWNVDYLLYGTTLLGIIYFDQYIFSLQIGDGDIVFVENNNIEYIIPPQKILGIETQSLSEKNAFSKISTRLNNVSHYMNQPFMIMASTDGFANSFISESEYYLSCREYFQSIIEYGEELVEKNLKNWLLETSKMGCGDDISVAIVFLNPL